MKKQLIYIQAATSFLFWDICAYLARVESWGILRRQSKQILDLIHEGDKSKIDIKIVEITGTTPGDKIIEANG